MVSCSGRQRNKDWRKVRTSTSLWKAREVRVIFLACSLSALMIFGWQCP